MNDTVPRFPFVCAEFLEGTYDRKCFWGVAVSFLACRGAVLILHFELVAKAVTCSGDCVLHLGHTTIEVFSGGPATSPVDALLKQGRLGTADKNDSTSWQAVLKQTIRSVCALLSQEYFIDDVEHQWKPDCTDEKDQDQS